MISKADRQEVIMLINEARKSGARLEPACEVVGISIRTYQRWVKQGPDTADKRPTINKRKAPANKLSQKEKGQVIEVCNSPKFVDLTPAQIVPKLADEGIYIASESTMYRILKEEKLNAQRVPVKNANKGVLTTHIATGPNQVWTWDITWLLGPVLGFYYKLYMIVDIFSRFIVGWEIHEKELTIHAKRLIKKTTFKHGKYGEVLVLHSDNGSIQKAQDFQSLLAKLGITKSYSRPRVSNDNAFSEALFKTLKYTKDFPINGFATIDDARKWVAGFVELYNNEFLHSGIKFVTPYQRHYGLDKDILAKRDLVYKAARAKTPERWSKKTRNWTWIDQVALNPTKELDSVKRETVNKLKRQLS